MVAKRCDDDDGRAETAVRGGGEGGMHLIERVQVLRWVVSQLLPVAIRIRHISRAQRVLCARRIWESSATSNNTILRVGSPNGRSP